MTKRPRKTTHPILTPIQDAISKAGVRVEFDYQQHLGRKSSRVRVTPYLRIFLGRHWDGDLFCFLYGDELEIQEAWNGPITAEIDLRDPTSLDQLEKLLAQLGVKGVKLC